MSTSCAKPGSTLDGKIAGLLRSAWRVEFLLYGTGPAPAISRSRRVRDQRACGQPRISTISFRRR
jgi:hypothetical protein